MLKRRKRGTGRAGELVVVPSNSGLAVFGEPGAVERFVQEITQVAPRPGSLRRAVIDAAQIGATIGGLASTTGEYVQLSEKTMQQLAEHHPKRASSGYFPGVVRAPDGSILSHIEWTPVDFAPQQMLMLQQAATMVALRMAIHEVTEATGRVEGKLDVVNDLVRSQRVGNAIGDYRFLAALGERVDAGEPLDETDWSTVEHLGAEITRDIESLRAFVRMRLADEQERGSTWSRAQRLAVLSASHFDEILGALLLCEHNLMTWQRLKIARHVHAELDRVESAVHAAQRALEANRHEDQRLVSDLEREIDELTEARGLEGLVPMKRKQIIEEAATLNGTVDWFAEQRTLDVTDTTVRLPGIRESMNALKDRAVDTSRSAKSAVTSRVRRATPDGVPELGAGEQTSTDG